MSWTSSERLLCVQFTFYVQGVQQNLGFHNAQIENYKRFLESNFRKVIGSKSLGKFHLSKYAIWCYSNRGKKPQIFEKGR